MYLCEKLLLEYSERLNGNTSPLYNAVLYCVILSPLNVRLKCIPILKRIVGSLGGTVIARALFKELLKILETPKTQVSQQLNAIFILKTHFLQTKNEKEANTRDLSAHSVVQCITALCSGTGISSEETNLLLLEALFPAHHPLVVTAAPELWTKVVKYHKISPTAFVIQQRAYFKKELIEGYKVNAVSSVF